jgi:NADH dehydrogenase FAD-containing subunit
MEIVLFDYLVLAVGARQFYFGNDAWNPLLRA